MAPQRPAMAFRGQKRRGLRTLSIVMSAAAATLLLSSASWLFTGPLRVQSSTVSTVVPRRAGFSEDAPKKGDVVKRRQTIEITKEQLERDHADKWELVDAILKGNKAKSPEAMMRARFTALRYKDPNFLGATEQDESVSLKTRTEDWAVTLGVKEKSFWDTVRTWGTQTDALQTAQSFEVVDATEDEVEFKIRCENGKVLHERSKFVADKKWGFVYSGESSFANWS